MPKCCYYLYFLEYLSISQCLFSSVGKIAIHLEKLISTKENIFHKRNTIEVLNYSNINKNRLSYQKDYNLLRTITGKSRRD